MAGKLQYPVYIISKGRAFNPLTAKHFQREGLPFIMAVEPQEADEYSKAVGRENLLVLPFANLGLGSYPARNYCWEHAKAAGNAYHWILDDNILHWRKWVNGFRAKWDKIHDAFSYVESYTNRNHVDIAGFEEYNFCPRPTKKPFKRNCHVYSAMLIKSSLPYRWRLKYNEDVDLCLQVLHDGGTTASCMYYLQNKVSTSAKMKGGNQTDLYQGNDPRKKLLKAKMLEAVWPQYAKTVIRFGRYHHYVDWKVFKKKSKVA